MGEIKVSKKSLVYSSPDSKRFIEGALELHSVVERRSDSRMLEEFVEMALLPYEEKFSSLVRGIYTGEFSCFEVLARLFLVFEECVGRETDFRTHTKKIVEYMSSRFFSEIFPRSEENKAWREYFRESIEHIIRFVERDSWQQEDTLFDEVTELKKMTEAIFAETKFLLVKDFVFWFARNWEEIGGNKNAYKALFALCKIVDPVITDNPQDKIRLAKLVKLNYVNWK